MQPAVAAAVLERGGALVHDGLARRGGDRLGGHQVDVGHAAGERDHVGARCGGEQVADGAAAHAGYAVGVSVVPPVEHDSCGTHAVHLTGNNKTPSA